MEDALGLYPNLCIYIYILAKQPPKQKERKIKWKRFGVPSAPQIFLNLPRCHEDSEYVLSFEIGQWEVSFYSGRTDTQTATPSIPH